MLLKMSWALLGQKSDSSSSLPEVISGGRFEQYADYPTVASTKTYVQNTLLCSLF